jgi:radical SAM protein with 4Fe4S-binding SPASM domain
MSLSSAKQILGWPGHRLNEGYRARDLPSLALARIRGLSAQTWEENLNQRETAAQVQTMRSTPRTLFLEVTGRCPIVCLMCARRYRTWQFGDLDEAVFERLTGVFPRVRMVVLGGFGEPLVAERFDDWFDRLSSLRANVALQTSGYRLTEERAARLVSGGLKHLHISIDSPEEETYRTIRPRIAFQEVTERIRQIVRLKREAGSALPAVHVVFVAMRRNVEQLPAMVDFVADLGADNLTVQYVVVHSEDLREESLFYHQDLGNRMLDAAEARAAERGLNVALPARFGAAASESSSICTDPWQVAYIRWNGEFRPCCYAPSSVVMGDLKEQSFWRIWNGPVYRELRRRVNSGHPPVYCQRCTMGRMCGVDQEPAHVLIAPD